MTRLLRRLLGPRDPDPLRWLGLLLGAPVERPRTHACPLGGWCACASWDRCETPTDPTA